MKLLLAIAATVFYVLQPFQTLTDAPPPDLIVVKFSCGQNENNSRMIRSVQEPDPPRNEPIRIEQQKKDEPQELINRRDMEERRASMRAAEINATLSRQAGSGSTIYIYRIEVRNTSPKIVKSFAWSYQPGDLPDFSDRQFYCMLKTKPNEMKALELFTPLAPSRVVDASKSENGPDNTDIRKVFINKIEYTDGSVWKRQGWNVATFKPVDTDKVVNGRCIGL